MKFVDRVKVMVASGDGGNGCVSFRRERYVPRGGPNGGDGGHGGSVIFKADLSKQTLIDLSFHRHIRADRGDHGKGSDRHGRKAEDRIVHLPPGTVVKDPESGAVLADLDRPGATWVAAKGGRGGRGNARFLSNANRAPREFEPGFPGQEGWLLLELKLIADIGLVGFPNAGKSTLLSKLTRRRPKVAGYPFTTLSPLLGVHVAPGGREIVLADLPGLIEGAGEGAGLGLQFLRHVERTRALIHVIDVLDPQREDPLAAYDAIGAELESYSPDLITKPRVVALNKIDLPGGLDAARAAQEAFADRGVRTLLISADQQQGLPELVEAAVALLEKPPEPEWIEPQGGKAP
ncbi:MAG: GTPase ObgE [Candidatus Alcyoniella australis]|nr:GTPase ObgE [Candidatus Alcyoniella australis]